MCKIIQTVGEVVMKKLVYFTVLLLLFSSAVLSAEIRDTVLVSREVRPDVYCFSLSVFSRGRSESSVLKALSEVDSYVRALRFRYRGGNFTVLPNREWISTERRYRTVGFIGRINYRFLLKDPSQQERIIKALEEAKGRVPFNYSISSVRWCVSDALRKRVQRQLKLKALGEAELEAAIFGKKLRSKCSIEKISFSGGGFPIVMGTVRAESLKLPKPPQSSQKLELKASILINCR